MNSNHKLVWSKIIVLTFHNSMLTDEIITKSHFLSELSVISLKYAS